jgi:hypothetical protein
MTEKKEENSNGNNVRFNLWTVLAFLFIMGVAAASFLYAEGKETKLVQREVMQRVAKMEAQFQYITCGIEDLKQGQKELSKQLAAHERNGKAK